jgi:hypothetical protein
MKYGILIGLISAIITLPAFQCCKGEVDPPLTNGCYKGRLEIAGTCRNYTISVQGGNIDTGKIEASWTDPTTNKPYQNVFRLGNYCSFPDHIKVGDEFYFTIANSEDKDCVTCMAFYPTPQKRLFIKVQNSGCGVL